LQACHGRAGCLFVTAPDVVGDATATLALWPFWSALIRGVGFAPAFVAQDGMTVAQLPSGVGALFIGGTTTFKLSADARTLVAYAKARELWTHMGRVNTRRRLREAYRWGIDSIDGTSRSMFPQTQVTKDQRWMNEWQQQPALSL
jgi:ribosome modulation factor